MLKTLAVVLFALSMTGMARAEVRVARAPEVGAIQLSGRSVVYSDEIFKVESIDTVTYVDRIVRARPGHRGVVLAQPSSTLDSAFAEGDDELRWDASSKALLTGVGSTDYEASDVRYGARVRGGLLGQKPFAFSTCYEDATAGTPAVSVWDTLGAYTNNCGSGRLLVRDLAHPHSDPLFKTEADGDAADLAGDYVAFPDYKGSKAGIAVYNWRDGTLLYRVTARLWTDDYGSGSTFELQPDGKLAAVVMGRDENCEAAWYSPREPTAHMVGRTSCGADIRLRSNRLVWMRIGKRAGELVVDALGGPGRAVARFPAIPPAERGGYVSDSTALQQFAWDGRRLAYGIRRCDGRSAVLLRRRVGGPVRRDSAPVRCPFRVRGHVFRVKRGARSIRLPMRCPRGCGGFMEIRRSPTRTSDAVDQPFAMRSRGRGRRLLLDHRTRSLLAHRGSARMLVWIEVPDRLGIDTRQVLHLRLSAR
jgi:hypothetical protein